MDEVILEEFKGTGNIETALEMVNLLRQLPER
jgi:transcription termination factor Rho